jgi:CRP-like cAMP-binding protein
MSELGDASFESLPRALRDLAHVTPMRRKNVLFRRGDPASAVFCVLSGEVRLVRTTAEGGEIVQHRARAGEFFGEAALAGAHFHCDAVCSAAGRVAVFDAPKLRSCLLGDPALALLWIGMLSRHLRAARMRIERLGLKGARRRILHWLATETGDTGAAGIQRPVKAWAAELGLAHETLYRELARLQAEGLVQRRGRSVTLRKP